MGNYESPTIEAAGGSGNHMEPQVFVAIVDYVVFAEFMYMWVYNKITGIPEPPSYYT